MTDRPSPFTALRAVEAASPPSQDFHLPRRGTTRSPTAHVSQSIRRLESGCSARALFERKGEVRWSRPRPRCACACRPIPRPSEALEPHPARVTRADRAPRPLVGGDARRLRPPVVHQQDRPAEPRRCRMRRSRCGVRTWQDVRRGDLDRRLRKAWTAEKVIADVPVLAWSPRCAPSSAQRGFRLGLGPRLRAAADRRQRRSAGAGWAARCRTAAKPPRAHVFDDAAGPWPLEAADPGRGRGAVERLRRRSPTWRSGRLVALPASEAPGPANGWTCGSKPDPGAADVRPSASCCGCAW